MEITLPRVNLGFLPTPLVFLKNLSAHLNGPDIYMKRDDCTGLATGGNKTRKLEYLLAQALEQGCDTILTGGGLQSNHVRQTAAAAAQLGLKCVLVLSESQTRSDPAFKKNGNVVLDTILGATLHIVSKDTNVAEELQNVYKKLKQEGANPYLVPIGGSNAIGATGYVNAIDELFQQCQALQLVATHLVSATGSGGTQAGIIAGMHYKNWKIKNIGFCVGLKNPVEKVRVQTVLNGICDLYKIDPASMPQDYEIDESYIGGGYGQPTQECIEAIKLLAQTEGILMDPVYTGKAMAGLIDYVKKNKFAKSDKIIFIHTGGSTALHAYVDEFRCSN
jgi:L-cysteate sulfo-lyase